MVEIDSGALCVELLLHRCQTATLPAYLFVHLLAHELRAYLLAVQPYILVLEAPEE